MDLGGISGYLLFFVTMAGIYAIATLGLNIHWGFTGLFNVGLSASFAIGAYTSAILTLVPVPEHLGGFGFPIIIGWIGGAIMAGIGALLVGIPTLRLKGDYLAIATLGIATTIVLVIRNEKWLSNGVWGIRDIPQPLHGIVEPHNYPLIYMILVLIVLAVTYFLLERFIKSPWGRVLRAIREDEVAATAAGKNVFSFKVQSLVLGSMVVGLSGALYTHFIRFISPDAFNPIMSTFIIWIMLTVGGKANNRGAILGAFVVWGIWVCTEFFTNFLPAAFTTRAGFMRIILIGLLLEIMLLKKPQGLLSEMKKTSLSLKKK
jgi:branched-chain amino acid transport system permease protein